MAVELDSPTLGIGSDWNSFYATEPLQPQDPYSPSSFGMLLFGEPDAQSARDLLGVTSVIGGLTFADIGGTIAISQLPPGSLVSVDSIDADALYFFDNTTGLPRLINAADAAAFIGLALTFADIGGTISLSQFPPGTVASLDSIDQDAVYFFDNTLSQPKLIGAVDLAAFVGLSSLTFAGIGGTIGVNQFPAGSVAALDSINEDAVYFFDNTLGLPKLINATDLSNFVGLSSLTFASIGGTIELSQFPAGSVATLDSIDEDALYFFDNTLFVPKLINAADALTFLGITGGGGSFLSNNTARVDPSGNDSTGTIGDLGKPFLTVQAVADAIQALSPGNGAGYMIRLTGTNALAGSFGSVSTPLRHLVFISDGGDSAVVGSVTFTSTALPGVALYLLDTSVGNVTATNLDPGETLWIDGTNFQCGDVTSSASIKILPDGGLIVLSDITAAEDVQVNGAGDAGTITCGNDRTIRMQKCSPSIYAFDYISYRPNINIDAPGASTVSLVDCLVHNVIAAGTLNLTDSRFTGTNNASSTVYADVLLLPRYQMSIDFDATAGLKLFNDSATPGNSKYYGTDSGGTKGFFALPSSGSGDVVGPSNSIDSEVVLFNSTTGKLIKRATGSGLAVLTSGVLSTTTNNSSNWDTAYTERHQWDGGATNLVAATGRTSLGLVIGTNVQAWDADLDALAALSGTNNIYYRSAANTWTSVTIGSNMTFSGGTLNSSAPGTGTVTSIGLSTDRSWLTVGSSPVTTSGTITINGTTGLTANQVLATPNGSTGTVGLRALVAADIPAIAESGVTGLVSDLALKAPLASPALTGAPTAPTQSQGNNSTAISTTAYTDLAVANAIAGVNPAVAVAAATTAAADTSAFTYANGVGGIGATLTGPTANVAVTIDGFTFTAVGQRLLVKNDTQSPSGAFNGVYFLSTLQITAVKPVFTRALDYDQGTDINNTGAIPVVNGTANIDTSWLLTSSVTTVGTDPLTYVQFSINPTTIVTTSRTLTIGGTAFDLSADRSWLGNVTNDTQTKSAIVPNTAPSAGQILAGNAGGTAYAPVTLSGSGATATLSSAGLLTLSAIPNATLSNSAITIAGTSTSLGSSITLDTISGVSSNGFLKRTGANTWTNDSSTYLTANQTITLSGDVTGSGTTAITTVVANIPTAVTMAGYLAATAIAAPSTPAAGIGRIYVDSTSKNLSVKDDAGTIKHGVQTKASVASNFLTAISDAGVVSASQPADADISFTDITTGNATTSQHGFMQKFPGGTSNFLRADGTFAAPSGTGAVASDVIWDAKGDLAVGTGADTAVKLTVGANDTMLMADSSQTTGIKWATPATVRTALALIASTTDVLAGNGTGSSTSAGFAPSNVALLDTANAFTANNSFSKAITFSGTISPTALSGNVNDYNPAGLSTALALRIDGGASDRNITGLSGGADGRIITITNVGSTNNLVMTNQDAGSTAANRFLLPANVTMPINTALAFRYDGTTSRWRPWSRALTDTGVTAASYGSASQVGTFTVDTQGRLSAASNTSIAIDTSALTSGTLAPGRFPFGLVLALNLGLTGC